jgi:type I restriction enzyme S subunit
METETSVKKTKRSPDLRFQEFRDEWSKRKLGEIFQINAGGDIRKENVSPVKTGEFQYPIYANAEKNKGFYGYSNIFTVEPGTVTVAGRGVNIGIAHARNHEFYPIVRLLVLKPKKGENIYFWEYAINRVNWFVESTGVPQLTAPQLAGYKVAFPSITEQQKIASFLSAVDKKIQQLTRKKELLETYKKGVMQKLFSQEIRFKDVDGKDFPDWEVKKIKEVSFVNPKNSELPQSFIYIDLESVDSGRLIKERRISAAEAPSRAQRKLEKDDILFQTVRPYQKNNLFFERKGDYIASTGYAQLRVKENSMFLYQLLHTEEFVGKVMKRCTGTSFPAINSNDLAKIKIKIPVEKEQQKIGNFLSAIDKKIEAVSQQIEKTQSFKKGLLQQLFV